MAIYNPFQQDQRRIQKIGIPQAQPRAPQPPIVPTNNPSSTRSVGAAQMQQVRQPAPQPQPQPPAQQQGAPPASMPMQAQMQQQVQGQGGLNFASSPFAGMTTSGMHAMGNPGGGPGSSLSNMLATSGVSMSSPAQQAVNNVGGFYPGAPHFYGNAGQGANTVQPDPSTVGNSGHRNPDGGYTDTTTGTTYDANGKPEGQAANGVPPNWNAMTPQQQLDWINQQKGQAIAGLFGQGPQDTTDQEALIKQLMGDQIGQNLADQRASMGRAGFGASGAEAGLEQDAQRQGREAALQSIFGVRQQAQQNWLNDLNAGFNADAQQQQLANENAWLDNLSKMLNNDPNAAPPSPATAGVFGDRNNPNAPGIFGDPHSSTSGESLHSTTPTGSMDQGQTGWHEGAPVYDTAPPGASPAPSGMQSDYPGYDLYVSGGALIYVKHKG